jgi:hypothetical protein
VTLSLFVPFLPFCETGFDVLPPCAPLADFVSYIVPEMFAASSRW